jgi:hypothetical protein
MKEHPILFSAPMVRAILKGRKTMRRWVINPQPAFDTDGFWQWKDYQWLDGGLGMPESAIKDYAPYAVGDHLCLRRITLEVTGIRCERLQDISEEDARAEGIDTLDYMGNVWFRDYSLPDSDASVSPMLTSPIESFRTYWESINGDVSWEKNPWVWVILFRRIKK